jgi:RNAse (barnase) inhibitor barstar
MEYRLDCSNVDCAKELHQRISECLSFPDWYGNNLDALYDCLTEIGSPTHLILQNWDDTHSFSLGFRCVFEEAELDTPDLIVTFE